MTRTETQSHRVFGKRISVQLTLNKAGQQIAGPVVTGRLLPGLAPHLDQHEFIAHKLRRGVAESHVKVPA